MEQSEVQRKVESIILDLEMAKDIETKHQVHQVMADRGRAFITGFREDFSQELQALERAYQKSLELLDSLSDSKG